jgi:hypothetical protein
MEIDSTKESILEDLMKFSATKSVFFMTNPARYVRLLIENPRIGKLISFKSSRVGAIVVDLGIDKI